MVDWKKRIHKVAGSELPTGDNIVEAGLLQAPGANRAAAGGAAGGLIGMAVASKIGKKVDGEPVSDRGLAASLPQGTLVVGLTSSGRLLFYDQGKMSGKPKGQQATLVRADIAAIEVLPGKLTEAVTVTFSDGTGRQFESQRLDKGINRLAEMFRPVGT